MRNITVAVSGDAPLQVLTPIPRQAKTHTRTGD
jgi:hypothetical protein